MEHAIDDSPPDTDNDEDDDASADQPSTTNKNSTSTLNKKHQSPPPTPPTPPRTIRSHHDPGKSIGITYMDQKKFIEKAKFMPLRLTHEERQMLKVVEAAVNVSEYTDKVDCIGRGNAYKTPNNKAKTIQAQLKGMCAILTGIMVAADYDEGEKMMRTKEFANNAQYYQKCFEVARRYKAMNPEKMRESYGKIMHVLQDAQNTHIKELMGFEIVIPMKTIQTLVKQKKCEEILEDQLLKIACGSIVTEGRKRAEIQKSITLKQEALHQLIKKYRNKMNEEEVRAVVGSANDWTTFMQFNVAPILFLFNALHRYFHRDTYTCDDDCLAIYAGREGARLTHSHKQQYQYVEQSLILWGLILRDMFELLILSENDMLNGQNPYRLTNTGQGLNRVQSCPEVSRAMHNILSKAMTKCGAWIGSSVIHLGDANVPNALIFLDKYTQVVRIIAPIVSALKNLDRIYEENVDGLVDYVDKTFGGKEAAKRLVLCDFMRHGFDGSGADSFFSAGSCIDGRLTSAWEWCSKIAKKSYYPLFLLSGFQSFDGEW